MTKKDYREGTLRDFFEDCYLLIRLGGASDKKQATTADSYRQFLSIWEQLMGTDVKLKDIDTLILATFRDELSNRTWRGKQVSANTVRKHFRHLNALLNFAGPRGRHARDAMGIIPEVPWVKSPREVSRVPQPAKLENIQRLMKVLHLARLPVGEFWPGDWWRAFYMLALNTGCRFGTLVQIKWSYIQGDELVIPGEDTKGNKDLTVPILPSTRMALDAMLGFSDTYVLPNEHQHESTLFSENSRLNKLAGLTGSDRVTSQSVRRFVLTQLSMVSPTAAQQAASHSSYNTTLRAYLGNQVLAVATSDLDLCAAVSRN